MHLTTLMETMETTPKPTQSNRHILTGDAFADNPDLAANVEGLSLYFATIYSDQTTDQKRAVNTILTNFGNNVLSLPEPLQAEGMGFFSGVVFDAFENHDLFTPEPTHNFTPGFLFSCLMAAYKRRGVPTGELEEKMSMLDSISVLGVNISTSEHLKGSTSVFYDGFNLSSPPPKTTFRRAQNVTNSQIISGNGNNVNQVSSTHINQATTGEGNVTLGKSSGSINIDQSTTKWSHRDRFGY